MKNKANKHNWKICIECISPPFLDELHSLNSHFSLSVSTYNHVIQDYIPISAAAVVIPHDVLLGHQSVPVKDSQHSN